MSRQTSTPIKMEPGCQSMPVTAAPLVIGIDFGTSYCTVGVFRNGQVDILKSKSGGYQRTPSCVSIVDSGGFTVGEEVLKEMVAINRTPGRVIIHGVPSLIKRRAVEDFHLITNEHNDGVFNFGEKELTMPISVKYKGESRLLFAEQICALLLSHLKESAEAGFGMPVTDAVVTVPSFFSYTHRQALEDAAKFAGLNTLRLINAPAAAVLAYCFVHKIQGKRNILVFDYGGGNIDVAIATVENGWVVVKECVGEVDMGGDTLDKKMADSVIKKLKKKQQWRFNRRHPKGGSMRRLRFACEEAKKKFSHSDCSIAEIEIAGFMDGIDLKTTVTRARFEKICEKVFTEELGVMIDLALKNVSLEMVDIHEVVMVGGSSRITKIQELLRRKQDRLGPQPLLRLCTEVTVAMGAAIYAALLRNGDKPKELEGMGLIDIIPVALGVETKRGYMTTMIKMNSTFVTKRAQAFPMDALTHFGNQTHLDLKVSESLTSCATKKHKEIGIVNLRDISLAPRDHPQIEVTFEIDAKGTLRVTVVDRISGRESCDTITTRNYRFKTKEFDVILAEAAEFKADEGKRREWNLVKSEVETRCTDVEKRVDKYREEAARLDQVCEALTGKCNGIRGWLAKNIHAGKEEVDSKLRELERFCEPLMDKLFASPSLQVPAEGCGADANQPPRKRARRHSE